MTKMTNRDATKTGAVDALSVAHVEGSLTTALSREAPERQKIDELADMFSRSCLIEPSTASPANPRGSV